jgi:PLP dependent protein
MSTLEERYHQIQKQIQTAMGSEKAASKVTLIAVSKAQPVEAIEALYKLGQRDFGENYVQELTQKAMDLNRRRCSGIRWHFMGHLQTNKIKALIPFVHTVHSVDSEKLAKKLAAAWATSGRISHLPIFLEVNVEQEKSKTGIKPTEVKELSESIAKLPELQLQGLMCIPNPTSDVRKQFAQLKKLAHQCRSFTKGMLSMGMSNDYEIALKEGATHVRIGTAIFGQRE